MLNYASKFSIISSVRDREVIIMYKVEMKYERERRHA